ncbi:Ig-like domain repeat protein [Nocardioides psychrotolerans]|uniref:Ig-like domain repeat protein n=1 Tax=Nocardioides psychrotolerans TaxID=1005945 RepID=UPI0031380B07
MHRLKRAFGAAVATSVLASGAGIATAATAATAAAPQPTQEQKILLGLLEALNLPVLSGVPGVGSLITLTDPVWTVGGIINPLVTNTYTWMSNGIPIPGAPSLPTYTPTADDAGTQITALVTGSLLGILPVSVLTDALNIPLPAGGGGGGGTPDPTALIATVLPLLSGVPVVGSILAMLPVEWNLPGVTTTIQWFSNSIPIPGATGATLPLTDALAGSDVSAVVTGFVAGLPLVSVITDSLGISPAEPDAVTATAAPTVTGPGKVGTTLTGTDPTWSTENVATTYQWLRNSVVIPGATQKTYLLVGEDFGKQIALKTTGTKNGVTGTASSSPVLAKLGDALTATVSPSLSGNAAPGNLLTVQPGTWAGTPTPTFGYQWYVNGAPISGANASTYVVKATDAGRNLAVLVTANRTGYSPGTAPTAAVSVAKVASRTKLALPKKKVAQGKAGLLKITLAATGLKVAGKVTVFDGKRKLKTYTVRSADNGTRTVTLPKLKPGKHALTAVFGGSVATTASRSAKVVLTVLKKKR